MKLGISIAVYNGNINYLDDLFKSLVDTRKLGDFLEVIIVDNGSELFNNWKLISNWNLAFKFIMPKLNERLLLFSIIK